MATEQEIILKVGTDEAVKSIGDLKSNIKQLKSDLDGLDIGTEEYTETLNKLKLNQNALKDAMYATSSSMEDVAESAAGMSESYNSLVHRMAALKEEWRSTNDEARRNELGVQINSINDKLKAMDASTGNFSRNVGDYKNQMVSAFTATAGSAGAVINPLKNMKGGLMAISSTPVIAILGLLANIIMKVIQQLNSSEESMNRVKLALAPLSAGTTALTKVFQWLGDKIADAAEWFGKLAEKLGWVNEEMKEHQSITEEEIALVKDRRKVEEENADSMLKIAKLKAQAAEKDKFTAKERLDFINQAAEEEKQIADRNIEIARREYDVLKRKADLAENSAEENDALSQAYVKLQNAETDYFNKTRELSAQRVEAINQIKAETKANEELLKSQQNLQMEDDGYSEDEEADRAWLDAMEAREKAEMDAVASLALKKIEAKEAENAALMEAEAELTRQLEEEGKKRKAQEEADAEATKKIRTQGLLETAGAVANILSSIADTMDVNNEKEFKRQQGLQIAAATINTIAGAVGAFMQAAATYPEPAGAIIGAVQAAAVTAAGIAQIAQIKKQKYNKSGSSSGSSPSAVSGSATAPNVETNLPLTRQVTSATEEERLNSRTSVRAYIVDSDLQENQTRHEQIDQETSF